MTWESLWGLILRRKQCLLLNCTSDVCNNRDKCTGFEWCKETIWKNGYRSLHRQGDCVTYWGGHLNVKEDENRNQAGSTWFSCLKIEMVEEGEVDLSSSYYESLAFF